MKKEKKSSKKFYLIIILLIFIAGVFTATKFIGLGGANRKITSQLISGKIESLEELTVKKLTYSGIVTFEEGSVPIITKKQFFMKYEASTKAFVDLSKADVKISNKTIKITLPNAELEKINVDPDSIQFYDIKKAILNFNTKQDGIDALKEAQKDFENTADVDDLIDESNEEAENIITDSIKKIAPDYTIEITFK